MILIIIGIIHEIDNKTTTPPTVAKIGVIMLLFAWSILSAWVVLSLHNTEQSYTMVPLKAQGSKEPAFGTAPAYHEATIVSNVFFTPNEHINSADSCFMELLPCYHSLVVATSMPPLISS